MLLTRCRSEITCQIRPLNRDMAFCRANMSEAEANEPAQADTYQRAWIICLTNSELRQNKNILMSTQLSRLGDKDWNGYTA